MQRLMDRNTNGEPFQMPWARRQSWILRNILWRRSWRFSIIESRKETKMSNLSKIFDLITRMVELSACTDIIGGETIHSSRRTLSKSQNIAAGKRNPRAENGNMLSLQTGRLVSHWQDVFVVTICCSNLFIIAPCFAFFMDVPQLYVFISLWQTHSTASFCSARYWSSRYWLVIFQKPMTPASRSSARYEISCYIISLSCNCVMQPLKRHPALVLYWS